MGEVERAASLIIEHSGYFARVGEIKAGLWSLWIAPRMEGVTEGDLTEYPEYRATSKEGVLQNIVDFGLGAISGPKRDVFCDMLDDRIDAVKRF